MSKIVPLTLPLSPVGLCRDNKNRAKIGRKRWSGGKPDCLFHLGYDYDTVSVGRGRGAEMPYIDHLRQEVMLLFLSIDNP
jgi:hypothetical protein